MKNPSGRHAGTWFNRAAFRQPYPELVDALFASGEALPAIVVFADGWTSFGGSQFLDSPATGRYRSYLCDEIVPFVDARYRTVADRDHRALAGKSTGGYCAMVTPMLRPDLFGALATHAGGALFDVGYRNELPRRSRLLRDLYGGYLDYGATAFRRALKAVGVPDDRIYFELFDAGHGGIEYRYPLALAWPSERMSA
ncbi:alpha/beta hydrolase-fold protein [Spirillospora sp. NPDC052269]